MSDLTHKKNKLTQKIQTYIPLAATMKVQVQDMSDQGVSLYLPFEPNKNHMGSVFGGSLHVATVLSCWGLVEHLWDIEGLDVKYTVIQSSDMKYLKPVKSSFVAKSSFQSPEDKTKFLDHLSRKKKARIFLNSEVYCNTQLCAQFTGAFVAELKDESK